MHAERLDDVEFVVSCEMDSTPDDVSATLAGISELLRAEGLTLPEDCSWELVVAEVLNNIVEHAYQDTAGGRVLVKLNFEAERLRVRFTDFGLPMPSGAPPPGTPANVDVPIDELPEGGFGWFLIRSLSEDLTYTHDGNGNQLSLTIPLPPQPDS
jgi:serine/threonine-protein kinase RsbW